LMDPHTATCFKSFDTKCKSNIKSVVYSTAEWTKFSPVIADALTGEKNQKDIDALESIASAANLEIPLMIKELFTKKVVHDTVIEKENIEEEILKFL